GRAAAPHGQPRRRGAVARSRRACGSAGRAEADGQPAGIRPAAADGPRQRQARGDAALRRRPGDTGPGVPGRGAGPVHGQARRTLTPLAGPGGTRMSETMQIHTVVSQPFAENSYVVWLPSRNDALVIDPGFEPDLIVDFLREQGLTAAAILNTHGHVDHIAGNA